jgi:hypothetical protein
VAVGAPIAEDDDGRPAVDVTPMTLLERAQGTPVVRVVIGLDDSGARPSPRHGIAGGRPRKEVRGLAHVADEHERARALEELLERVHQLEEESRYRADGVAHVAENDDTWTGALPTASLENERRTPGAEGGPEREVGIDRAAGPTAAGSASSGPHSVGERAEGVSNERRLPLIQRGERGRLGSAVLPACLRCDAGLVRAAREAAERRVGAFYFARQGVGESISTLAEGLNEEEPQLRMGAAGGVDPGVAKEAVREVPELQVAAGVDCVGDARLDERMA